MIIKGTKWEEQAKPDVNDDNLPYEFIDQLLEKLALSPSA